MVALISDIGRDLVPKILPRVLQKDCPYPTRWISAEYAERVVERACHRPLGKTPGDNSRIALTGSRSHPGRARGRPAHARRPVSTAIRQGPRCGGERVSSRADTESAAR